MHRYLFCCNILLGGTTGKVLEHMQKGFCGVGDDLVTFAPKVDEYLKLCHHVVVNSDEEPDSTIAMVWNVVDRQTGEVPMGGTIKTP